MCWKITFSCVYIMSYLHLILSLPPTEYNREYKKESPNNPIVLDNMLKNNFNKDYGNQHKNNATCDTGKIRVKRAAGSDKFSEAATMTETKMFQMYLQLFKNLWASSYVGGGHPLHPDVPKPVVQLFKQRIMAFFFPPIGEDAKKV